jgi:hypothetical protein
MEFENTEGEAGRHSDNSVSAGGLTKYQKAPHQIQHQNHVPVKKNPYSKTFKGQIWPKIRKYLLCAL